MKNLLIGILVMIVLPASAQMIDTSKNQTIASSVNTDSVYLKVDVEAQFPGGEQKWNKYVLKNVQKNIDDIVKDKASGGTCVFKFIVDTEGNISAVRAMNMENSMLAKIMTDAILKGPKWVPAQVNSMNVKSLRTQKVTFRMP